MFTTLALQFLATVAATVVANYISARIEEQRKR